MNSRIIDLQDWFTSPPGRYLLEWERAQLDVAVADMFGFHALQLGLTELNGLAANRMPHRWMASPVPDPRATVVTDFSALPFGANSLDLVLLPHTLELSDDAHASLHEVERVLVPEGRVVICGFNPWSLWAAREHRARLYRKLGGGSLFLPAAGELIGYWRMRDWLRLLGFELEVARFGCYRPAFSSEAWLASMGWMERLGARWWPVFGAVYFLVAVKRVRGMTLLSPAWKRSKKMASSPASVATSTTTTTA